MRKILVILLTLIAIRLLPATLRRHADVVALLRLLVEMTAMTGSVNTSKTVNVEQRIGALIPAVGAAGATATTANSRVGALSGAQTGGVNVTAVVSNTSDPAVTGAVVFTAGVNPIASSDFTSVVNGHQHGYGHNHSYGHVHSHGHTHTLPAV